MLKKVKCSNCGTKHVINTEKHRFRPKYCTACRNPIDNLHPKLRVLSKFQMMKDERRRQSRERFIVRMLALRTPLAKIMKMLVKPMGSEASGKGE